MFEDIDKVVEKPYTIRIRFSCSPSDIIIVNAVIDSYGGLGLIRTLDKKQCNCAIFSTNTVYETALEVLKSLQSEGLDIRDIVVDKSEEVDDCLVNTEN